MESVKWKIDFQFSILNFPFARNARIVQVYALLLLPLLLFGFQGAGKAALLQPRATQRSGCEWRERNSENQNRAQRVGFGEEQRASTSIQAS